MDQGRQAGDPLDAAVVPSFPGERSAPATECPGLQPGQPLAQIGPAAAGQALVAHESPAAAGENRRPAGEACQVLLAPAALFGSSSTWTTGGEVLTPGSSGVGNLGGKEPTKSPNWPKELEKGLWCHSVGKVASPTAQKAKKRRDLFFRFLTQMCARFSPSRSAAPWEEAADVLVPANQW